VRAAAELTRFSLPDDTFDRFVPSVNRVAAREVLEVAQRWIKPDVCVAVVVGDATTCRSQLEQLGREIIDSTPEF
jgi:predicted Zn-dependent peptidase